MKERITVQNTTPRARVEKAVTRLAALPRARLLELGLEPGLVELLLEAAVLKAGRAAANYAILQGRCGAVTWQAFSPLAAAEQAARSRTGRIVRT